MKTILPWLLMVIAAGGAVFFYNGNQTKTAELAKLQAQVQELEAIRAEVEELKKNQVAPEELARLKESKDELLRLRNEVRQLRTDKTQLNQQAQAARTAAEQAQVAAARDREELAKVVSNQDQNTALTTARQIASDPALINACINNLRQIEAAKQQWALEHQKSAEATPTDKDLAAYFKNTLIPNTDIHVPVCPFGGKYTFGNLTVRPTCSAGHALPPPQ